jgi:hypothetical protein
MAYTLPTIPDDKIQFYRNKLWREVTNLFEWKGMPEEVPLDYLENVLVRKGMAAFFYDEKVYGHMVAEPTIVGYNMYKQPVDLYCVTPNTVGTPTRYDRKILHKYDELIPKEKAAVLINNMYRREPLWEIIEHFAKRLTMIQQAIDTNTLWQNIPVIFSAADDSMKLSIEKFFADIYTGQPWVMVDRMLLQDGNQVLANVAEVPFLLDKLMDAKNETYNEFKATIGLNAPGADKKERLVVAEATSNEESKETCLNIMLSQRKIACEEINKVFGLKVSVDFISQGELLEEEGMEDGQSDDGAQEGAGDRGI